MTLSIASEVPLAPLTTFELGGAARHLAHVQDVESLEEALRWASQEREPVAVLGGGSNLVIADEGFAGLVLRIGLRGVERARQGGRVLLTARAGEPWDELVATAIDEDLAGLECLSGIPGLVGATPIQNVGAYGQEIADTLEHVEVFDRLAQRAQRLNASQCAFAYRDSLFKHTPDRYVVLSVTFALRPHGRPTLRYAELTRALDLDVGADIQTSGASAPSLSQVRKTVIALRRGKSMVIDPSDENRRSAGSFFTNPIVTSERASEVVARAKALGVVQHDDEVPRYPQSDGRVKLAAGFLIERAGVKKGERTGQVGISSRHALSLVHHGGGRARELIALAEHVRARVHAAFGVTLEPEPVFLGFETPPFSQAQPS